MADIETTMKNARKSVRQAGKDVQKAWLSAPNPPLKKKLSNMLIEIETFEKNFLKAIKDH
ncbi:hypothetical protein [Tateyamaria sp.]|uniref:hypothetical protein n=1 Tax=Tateyamaria sp. TaxID=1929288 RepID=UPI00329DBBBC